LPLTLRPPRATADALRKAGVGAVVLTLGDRGAAICDGKETRIPAFKVKAVDVNGNGIFDNAETAANILQKGDPYLDVNENGSYVVGEPYFDINGSASYVGPTGLYAGLLCSNTNSLCAPQNTTYVGASSLIIMSGSNAVITDNVSGLWDISATGSGAVTFSIADVNNQPMPAKTTVVLTAPSGVTLGQPTSFAVPCTFNAGPGQYGFSASRTGGSGTGLATLTVTTPGGVQTLYTLPMKW
jgi:hypothetical protein